MVTTPGTSLFTRGKAPARPIVVIAIAISVASLIAGWVADAIAPDLVSRSPLALIAMSPRTRNLILATNSIDAAPYYLVGFFRLIASDPVNYLLGFWFGDRMLAWVKRRSKTYGPLVDSGADGFRKWSPFVIFAAPNNIVCMLAGATGVKFGTFIVLNVTGTITRLFLVRRAGEAFESPIDRVLDFIAQYRTPLLIVSVLAVGWTIFGEFRGDDSELAALRDLANEDDDGDDGDDGERDIHASADTPDGTAPDGDATTGD